MRAAVLTDDHTFDVVEVADPSPQPDELVLRVRACGICGSDLKAHKVLPAGSVLGHEFSGEVVAIGTACRERWHEGQHVAAMPLTACGQCRWCLADEPSHCERVDPATRGRVVIAGVCMAPDTVMPVTALIKEVEVRFAVYYKGDEFGAAARLLESGRVAADAMVTGAVPLDDVGGAFTRLLTSTADRKIVVTP